LRHASTRRGRSERAALSRREHGRSADRATAWLALGGIAGPSLLVASFTVAGWLRPGYSAVHDVVSDLGLGPHAWMVNGAALLNALLLTAWVFGFFRYTGTVLTSLWQWLCTALLELPPVGYALAALYTEAPATRDIHTFGAELALVSPAVAFFVVGLAFSRTPGRGWSICSFLASLATLILVAANVISFLSGAGTVAADARGLSERALIIETLAWYVVAGWRMARRAGSAPSGSF
jgi:hypothetical membrane protein